MATLKNLLIVLFSAVLLLQCCENVAAKPAQKSKSSEESSEEIAENGRDRLMVFTLTEFIKLGQFTVVQGKEILSNVTKDADVLKSESELLQQHFNNFTKFIERVDKFEQNSTKADLDDIETLFELVIDFADIAERYNTTALERPTVEDRLIEVSMKKNGLDKLEKDFGDRFLVFGQDMDTIVNTYFNSLSAKERENESKTIEWYDKFKSEKDVEKKVEIFAKFFELYA